MKLKIQYKQIFTILALTFCVGVRGSDDENDKKDSIDLSKIGQENPIPKSILNPNPNPNPNSNPYDKDENDNKKKKTTWSSILKNIKTYPNTNPKTTLFVVFVIGVIIFYKYFYKKKEKNPESIEELGKNNSEGL